MLSTATRRESGCPGRSTRSCHNPRVNFCHDQAVISFHQLPVEEERMLEREKNPEQELEELNSIGFLDSDLAIDIADSGRHPPVEKKARPTFLRS